MTVKGRQEIDKSSAYFLATGADDVAGVTEALAIAPSESWNVGDSFEVTAQRSRP